MKKFSIESLSHRSLFLILIVVSYFFLMFGNGIISLTNPDEVFYAQTAKEMITHHSWTVPYIFDEPQFEKPILFYVLLKAAMKWFGPHPFVARFWPAFFGMVGVLITYWITFLLYGDKRRSFWAGIILTTSFIYIALSRAILTDVVFSVFVIIALGFFYKGYKNVKDKTRGLIWFFIFAAIAVLTKGLLGLCFTIGSVLLFLALRKDLKFLWCRATLWGLLVFLLISVPWHAEMIIKFGNSFVHEYWNNVHVRRLFDSEHPKTNTWFFYPGLMFAGVMPWSLFLFPALYVLVKFSRTNSDNRAAMIFLFSWIIGVLTFVQPAASKLASYIFPLFPALAIILSNYFVHVMDQEGKRDKVFVSLSVLFAILLFVGPFVGVFFAKKHQNVVHTMGPVYLVMVLLWVCSLAMGISAILNKRKIVVKSIASLSVILLITLFFSKDMAEPWVSCRQICEIFRKIDNSDTVVLSSKFYVRGVRYYTDREMAVIDITGKGFYSPHPIPFLNTEDMVLDFLEERPFTYGIVKEGNLDDLKRIIGRRNLTLTQFEDMGGKYIIRIDRPKS